VEVERHLQLMQTRMGKTFGDPRDPLLLPLPPLRDGTARPWWARLLRAHRLVVRD
jgi:hypothetical protein